MIENAVLFRQATKEEIDFYFKKVYPLQDKVLEMIDKPGLMEGNALTIQPLDNDVFIEFTKKIIGDLLDDARKV